MAGQEEEEEEAAGVGNMGTSAGTDTIPDLEPTLEHDSDSELKLKQAWTFDVKGVIRADSGD